ncbi:MAG: IS200/IS605 family transposase [Candidatus Melainabacteria bacterium HGW-Melainabacteria-1]|nr:MAG: IS200/IS605 family transposase [Candidatus Melainabacteria bacterium HGW-Melainabacteria-1]
MQKSSDIRHGRHCVFKLHVHLVFVSKYRRKLFDTAALKTLENIFTEVCQDFDAELTGFNGEQDHVHLLVNYPPKVSVSKLVNSLKGVSSRLLRKLRPDLAEIYYQGMLWSPSYFAGSCGGAPLAMVQQYIEQQNAPD